MVCDFYHDDQQYQENSLVKYYLKHGHDVIVIASTFTSIFEYYSEEYCKTNSRTVENIGGYQIIREPYSINVFNRLRKLASFEKLLNDFVPDFIFVHGIPLNLIDPVAYKRKNPKVRLVYDSHADYSNSASNWISLTVLHKIIYRGVFQKFKKYIDDFFYITPSGGLFCEQVYNIGRNNLSLLPLGADLDVIAKVDKSEARSRVRGNLGIDPSDFVIVTGGKITRRKKLDLLIRAFQLMQLQTANLVIFGDSDDKALKDEIISLINGDSRIHFVGWVDGLQSYDYFLASDVAVFPSGQSVLWQQAISSGLPLILERSSVADASYLNRYNNIILIDELEMSAQMILKELTGLHDDPNALLAMRRGAKLTTDDILSYEKIAERTLGAIDA
jgi:1,2-diacylglycerol 3-alpha-glucosyltransferase